MVLDRPEIPLLTKTCDKVGISVWDYLGSRLKVVGHTLIQPLDHYVRSQIRLT